MQPQITKDFSILDLLIASNHFYAFFILSLIGILAYKNTQKINSLVKYLFLLSIILEFFHMIIPNRGFELSDLSLATSGDYQNYFVKNGVRHSHIIDPKTAYPITHKLASVTVLHKSAKMADGYATAILVMGEEHGKIFAKDHDLKVVMMIREANKYSYWSNTELFK